VYFSLLHPIHLPVGLEKYIFTAYGYESAKYMIHAEIAVPALPPFPPPPRGVVGGESRQETLRGM
jgi:hypothetical protein